jgi:DNA invertase Pin-like site-specific DNA recombinase
MATAHSYLRYSTPEQALGDSERRQIEKAQEWAVANAYDYDDTYRDPATSAFRSKNRAVGMLGQFFDDVRSGRIPKGDLLLTESFDRLSRDEPLKAFDLFRELVECGIILVTGFLTGSLQIYSRERLKREPWALHSVLGEMIRAHSESLNKSERVAASHEKKRRDGRESGTPIMGRTCPAWLDLSTDSTRYVVNEERAAIVRRMFTEAASGLGNLQIANRLNRDGIAPFRPVIKDRQTKGWQPGYIQKILSSEAVLGTFQPHRYVDGKRVREGPAIEGFFPRVIDDALYWRARQARDDRLRRGRGRIGPDYANLVKGIGRCGTCGGSLVYVDKTPISRHPERRKYVYLRCGAAAVGSCTNRAGFPYRRLEVMLFQISETSDRIAQMIPERADDTVAEQIAQLEAGLERRRAARKRFIEAFKDNDEPDLVDEINRLGAEVKQIEGELAKARRQARIDEHADRKLFMIRWREAIAKIESPDPDERLLARATVAQEFRRVIDAIVLHDDRHISVRVKKGQCDGNQLEYFVSRDTVERLRLTLADGQIVQVTNQQRRTILGPELLRGMLTPLIRKLAARGPLPKVMRSDEGGTFEIEVVREAAE